MEILANILFYLLLTAVIINVGIGINVFVKSEKKALDIKALTKDVISTITGLFIGGLLQYILGAMEMLDSFWW